MLKWPRGLFVVAVLMAIATFLALAGCSPAPVELTQDDSGSTQTLSSKQELRITLESNQTTGYQWAVDGDLPPQLKLVGQPDYKAPDSKLAGAPGTEVWTFMAASSGEGVLKLKYWRSFEPTAEPAETFQVTVKVE